ncbi:MAG: translation elongation factor 4 [bacterium]
MKSLSLIRNFCIVAHVDHGKSTLADRILQITKSIADRNFRDQVLDSMDLERERGITIKSHPVTMQYKAADGQLYDFNLIDTPGHVDFNYEVSRSMAACEGAVLVVDVAQGVEAQTVANTYLAVENDLEVVPVLNKIDLPNADIEGTVRQIHDVLGIDMPERLCISAKTGNGIAELMEAIVRRVPPPVGRQDGQLRALVFDSVYDSFRGVIAYVRVMEGTLRAGDKILLMATNGTSTIKEVGVFKPAPLAVKSLGAGEVGYFVSTIREPSELKIGDTVTTADSPAQKPLPGFRSVRPMVFSGVYPITADDHERLKHGIEKLSLNDSAFTHMSESSVVLGFGFRCGFLGLLHMEIVQERLRREFDLNIINTYPSVVYRVFLRDGSMLEIDNPINLPDSTRVDHIEEPMIKASIICHNENIGDVMKLVRDRRGILDRTDSIDQLRVMLICTVPLNEILVDFHDLLKSVSHGYASMDYDHAGYVPSDMVRMDILLNSEPVDAFSCMVHESKAQARGREICRLLKDAIPPHMFPIPVQAALGKTVIARETIRALRKDVTAKCYGGDISRKRKLLDRQKEGKRRMKLVGQVNVPQKAFISVLKAGM